MLELKQAKRSSAGPSDKEIAKFFNKRERWVLRRQTTEKEATFYFDQLFSKINRESEVQTERFNKEDFQESSAEKYRSFEHYYVTRK